MNEHSSAQKTKIASKTRSKKLKVCLVRAPVFSTTHALNNEATPAIALAYISAYLRKHGYNPVVVDGIGEALNRIWQPEKYPGYHCQGLTFDEIISRIPPDTDVIGFSCMFSGEWPLLRDLIEQSRIHFPNAVLVAGGEHVTALGQYSLQDCPALDICVRGEGEHTFLELLEGLEEGQGPETINGLGYLDDDGHYCESGGLPRLRELSDIPWPEWPEGYLEKFWEAGKSYGPQTDRDMPLLFSRGCPFRCTFCSNPQMWTTRYVLRDTDDVVAEVLYYKERYNITGVQLYDLTAITKKRWAIEFFNKIHDAGIQVQWAFPSGTRSEALDEETLSLMKQCGCNYLAFAPESGSPRMLEKLKKRITLEKITKSIRTAMRLGMIVRANIIIGFPGESRLDLFKTLYYGIKMSVLGVEEIQPNLYSPYPGSELFEGLHRDGRIILCDAYFLSLTSLNSDLSVARPLTFNEAMGSRELAFYRFFFTAFNYGIGYALRPHRIVRSIRNIFFKKHATTVFENRLKDLINRRTRSRQAP
ncbi:MAG: B12-binding domain-containing radical SAM protein [Rhodospirillales bacterium]|nr:B12-binding domain-containing radical SAM protein [Rhodospirillales bacterium]